MDEDLDACYLRWMGIQSLHSGSRHYCALQKCEMRFCSWNAQGVGGLLNMRLFMGSYYHINTDTSPSDLLFGTRGSILLLF
jgi:hypothetical protein